MDSTLDQPGERVQPDPIRQMWCGSQIKTSQTGSWLTVKITRNGGGLIAQEEESPLLDRPDSRGINNRPSLELGILPKGPKDQLAIEQKLG